MRKPLIRQANQNDLEQLTKLYGEFHEFHARRLPDRIVRSDRSRIPELHTAIQKIIADEHAAIFVAEVSGQLVGLAEVYLREDVPNSLKLPYTYGHLQSMVVTEAYRGSGIGTRILEAVEKWTKENDAAEIRLDTWEFAEGPLGFYEKRGYRTLRRMLVRKL